MIIVLDKADENSVVIWDDDNERLISFRPSWDNNVTAIQQEYPFSVIYTDYELIQYMEMYVKPKEAVEWANQYKGQLGDDYDKVMDIMKRIRGYQGMGHSGGSIVNPDLRR